MCQTHVGGDKLFVDDAGDTVPVIVDRLTGEVRQAQIFATTSMSRGVPYRFARNQVEVRLTGRTVEIFVKGERVAVYMRSSGNAKHPTAADHMPSSHRRYADWTIGRIRRDAALIGPATAALCDLILEQRPHPEQGFRSCLGILRLARLFGVARLEAAATRAIEIGALTYGSVRSSRPQARSTRGAPSAEG
jgi:transposase